MKKPTGKRKGISLFSKTLLMLSLLSLATILAMFFFINTIVTRSQRQRFQDLHSDHLKKTTVYIDGRIEAVERNNKQLLRSRDTITLMVNAGLKNSDTGYRVVDELKNCQDQNSLIHAAFLYLPTSHEVYSSQGKYLSVENASFSEDIGNYLSWRQNGRKPGEESVTRIMHSGEKIYAVTDFCVPNFIGCLFMELDMEELNQQLMADQSSSGVSYILLDDSRSIIMADPELGEDAEEVIRQNRFLDLDTGAAGDREDYIFQHSSLYDLIYGIHVDPAGNRVSVRSVAWMIFPFLLIYALFAEFYSLYISRTVYKPIDRLMQITAGDRKNVRNIVREQGQDELAYLENEFQSTLGENRQHRELMAAISQDVVSQLFRGILMGTTASRDYIRATMEGLGLADYLSGRYIALAGRICFDEERKRSTVEEGLYHRTLRALLDEAEVTDYLLVHFFADAETLAILFCFPEDASVIQIRTQTGQITDTLEEKTENLPFRVLFGRGKVYNDISSLRFSYQEAAEEVQYLCYMEEAPGEDPGRKPQEAVDYDQKYFSERGHHLADSAESDRLEESIRLSAALAEELCGCSPENRNMYMEQISEILVEKMISVHITAEEIRDMRMDEIMNDITQSQDSDGIRSAMKDLFAAAVKAIHTNSRRNRYRYVDTAKEYISMHYADGDLSLNEVSEAVGISAPYLSGIFTEVNKGGFSSYLSSYRVAQAKKYLEETSLSAADIGYKCGFNSAQSFSRVFKKQTGMAPGQYREQRTQSSKNRKKES